MGIYDHANNVDPNDRQNTPPLPEGSHRKVVVLSCEQFTSKKNRSKIFFKANMRVLESDVPGAVGQDGGLMLCVQGSDYPDLDFGALKAFAAAAFGIDPKDVARANREISGELLESLVGQSQPLAGFVLECKSCTHKVTAKAVIGQYSWGPVLDAKGEPEFRPEFRGRAQSSAPTSSAPTNSPPPPPPAGNNAPPPPPPPASSFPPPGWYLDPHGRGYYNAQGQIKTEAQLRAG